MRRFVIGTTVLTVTLGAVILGQGKIATPEDYARIMKSNAQAFPATNKAIGSGAFADAKTQLATVRSNYIALQDFWTGKKVPEAVTIVTDALTQIDALDKQLSAPTVDQMAAQATAKQIGGSCAACHKSQREGDAQTGWRFKPGVF